MLRSSSTSQWYQLHENYNHSRMSALLFFSPSPALYRASHWCTMPETHFKTTKNHLSGILLLVFTDVYFYTDSQIDHQTGTLQRAPRQENRENLKHSTLHAVLRSWSTPRWYKLHESYRHSTISAPLFFPPSLALPYWSLAGFRPLLSQVWICCNSG